MTTMNSRDGDDGLLGARLLAVVDGYACDCYTTRASRRNEKTAISHTFGVN